MKYATLSLLFLILLSGCLQKGNEAVPQEQESRRRTVWSGKTELFLEYNKPVAGEKATFLFHFTNLVTFKPVIEGALHLTFVTQAGQPWEVRIDAPEKAGIFRAPVSLPKKGRYTLKVAIAGNTFRDELVVEGIEVVDGTEKNPMEHWHGREGNTIAFSKEQQWTVDFRVGFPVRRTFPSSFSATGELIPISEREVAISAPLTGVLSVSNRLPHGGSKVAKDEVVAQIEPAVSQQGGVGQLSAAYADSKNRVVLAQNEYVRAKRLYGAKAVPRRRVDEAEIALNTAQAALEPLEKAMQALKEWRSEDKILVRSPLEGTVVEVFVSNGKAVEAGQALMRIIDTSRLWLRVNIPATEFGKLRILDQATFTIPGVEGELRPTRLVTVNEMVDAKSRTVPVIFEVSNRNHRLKVGMFSNVDIQTGQAQTGLTLPEEALFEDEGKYFVFLQKEGESFERREVKAGIHSQGSVQIAEGLQEDERVVTRGGYYVKLASLTSRTPQGHGHEH